MQNGALGCFNLMKNLFKNNWEKTDSLHKLKDGVVEAMVAQAMPGNTLNSYQIIKGGCANLNIKINLTESSYILRIYLRDKDAAYREQKLAELLKNSVPIPKIFYIGEYDIYRFSIAEFMEGITLREYLISNSSYEIMYEVGALFSKISSFSFPSPGFFDADLNVASNPSLIEFVDSILLNEKIITALDPLILSKLKLYLKKHLNALSNNLSSNLVHGDFDPSNILVKEIDGKWKVSAALDWEFSFSGSSLWDIANMLRYRHKMPKEFQDCFIKNLSLPNDWEAQIDTLNLTALLDLLSRTDAAKEPNRFADITDLITRIIDIN